MLIKKFFIFSFCYFAILEIGLAEVNQENKSIFSIFEQENAHLDDNKSIWINPDEEDGNNTVLIPKEVANNKDCNIANLKVIDVSFGRIVNLKNKVNEKLRFANLQIETKRCVQEVAVTLSPNYKAFIEIIERDTGVVVFNGWIFSGYKSFAQPIYGNYFFTLNWCSMTE
ncbi:MAG: DUF2155 domain-containing protein [Candidatus Midichloria sp.]|nr:MAG: DUF2155 domain-containing protein [Candidatus Midichloria sp.]